MAGLAVVINDAIRGGLEALTRAGNTAQKLARRARIVLLASQGQSDSEISRELDNNRKTAARWRQRIAEPETQEQAAEPTAAGAVEPIQQETVTPSATKETKEKSVSQGAVERLRDRRPRSGRKRVVTPEMRQRIIDITLREKPAGRTHWTTRSLAKHLSISKMAETTSLVVVQQFAELRQSLGGVEFFKSVDCENPHTGIPVAQCSDQPLN